MIQLKQYDDSFYEEIRSWWEGRSSTFVHPSMLPKTSCVACECDEGGEIIRPVAAAWAYLDNSVGFSMIAWPCICVDAPAKLKLEAINMVIDFLQNHILHDLHYGFIAAMPNTSSLVRLFSRQGFERLSEGGTFLGRGA
jgi:hypothetical protein